MSAGAVEVRFLGLEAHAHRLRAKFEIAAAGRQFIALADLSEGGAVTDIFASDTNCVGSTGNAEVDAVVRRRAEAELIRARSAAVVAAFDRRALTPRRAR